MRLTEKGYVSCNIDEDISCDYCPNASLEDCITKLGQLEDIEEELGIDLIILFKALKNGFYYKDDFGDIEHLDKQTLHLLVGEKYQELQKELKNYGKTWALTKEELE